MERPSRLDYSNIEQYVQDLEAYIDFIIKKRKYYNSDLSEYIGENLPREMISIDLDILAIKWERKIIRHAEYKHENEYLKKCQKQSLDLLSFFARTINKNPQLFDDWTCQVVELRGDKPYNVLQITDWITKKKYTLTKKEDINNFLCLNKVGSKLEIA